MLKLENLFKDTQYVNAQDMPHISEVDIEGNGYHLFGYILTPGAEYQGKQPCVIMSHGFPGYKTNNYIEHALRRMGCVVVHVNHRGAWGSEDNYFFSNLTGDIELIVKWILSQESIDKFNIDKDNLFLVGHSMGGMTVINATRKLKNIRGTVAIAPYDLDYGFRTGTENDLKEMIHEEGNCLKLTSEEELFEDARKNSKVLSIPEAADDLKERNILFVGADCDDIAPPQNMIEPLFSRLEQSGSEPYHEYVLLHTDHSLCGSRIQLANTIGEWIVKLIK